MKTISDIPGVNPSTVMELFSMQITALRKEIAVLRAANQTTENKYIKCQKELVHVQEAFENLQQAGEKGKNMKNQVCTPTKKVIVDDMEKDSLVGDHEASDVETNSTPGVENAESTRASSPWRRKYDAVLSQHGIVNDKRSPINVLGKLQEQCEK